MQQPTAQRLQHPAPSQGPKKVGMGLHQEQNPSLVLALVSLNHMKKQ